MGFDGCAVESFAVNLRLEGIIGKLYAFLHKNQRKKFGQDGRCDADYNGQARWFFLTDHAFHSYCKVESEFVVWQFKTASGVASRGHVHAATGCSRGKRVACFRYRPPGVRASEGMPRIRRAAKGCLIAALLQNPPARIASRSGRSWTAGRPDARLRSMGHSALVRKHKRLIEKHLRV